MIRPRLSQLRIILWRAKSSTEYVLSIVQSLRKSVRANPFSGQQSYFTLLYFYIETSLDNREALDSLHLL